MLLFFLHMKKLVGENKLIVGLVFLIFVLVLVIYFKYLGIIPSFENIKMYRTDVEVYLLQNLISGILIFASIYIVAIALSLPVATPLTILSGFLFESVIGTIIVAFAATIGATLALLIIRFFFRDYTDKKFGNKLDYINSELTGHGFRDVFVLRLTPLVPFSLINISAALTSIKVRSFFLATFFGTIPFTFVYVNAGTQLANIESVSDVVSLPILIGISLLVVVVSLPMIIRRKNR